MKTHTANPSNQAIYQSLQRLAEKRQQFYKRDYLSISTALGLNNHSIIAQRGEVWGLVGGVGAGKTALSLQFAVHLAKTNGLQTLFISPETPDYILHRRALQMLTKQTKAQVLGNLGNVDTATLGVLNCIRVLANAINKESLPNAIKLIQSREGRNFDLIVIDHLKLLDWQTDDIRIELEQFCPFIKHLAEKLNCIILLVNQVPKYVEQQLGQQRSKIQMVDVAEASGIYQVLDAGLIIDCPRGNSHSSRTIRVGKARDFSVVGLQQMMFSQNPDYWLFEPIKHSDDRRPTFNKAAILDCPNVSFF